MVAALLGAWRDAAAAGGARFAISCQLGFYNAAAVDPRRGGQLHPLGFAFEAIPERRHLRGIADELGVPFFDSYAFARERAVDTSDHYLHSRYAYPSSAGADYHARVIAQGLSAAGWLSAP